MRGVRSVKPSRRKTELVSPTLEQATALDPHWYLGDDLHQFDQREILQKHWQVIAPASALSDVGDVIARHIGGVPVAIVNTEEGLRGYINVCAHRAGPVVPCDARGQAVLRCGYHGWTYNLDGQLVNAPKMNEALGFNTQDIRLKGIDVTVWGGLIFARLQGNVDIAEFLVGVDSLVSSESLSAMNHRVSRVYDVATNWKVYVDNFLEGYHLPFVHPALTQAVDFPNYITETSQWSSVQRSPVPADNGAYGAGEAFYFFLFPNTMLNVMPGRLQTNRVIPISATQCRVEFDFYYLPEDEHRLEQDLTFTEQVQEEDRLICEHVQSGLQSGFYEAGRLSPAREAGVHHWHNLLRQKYATK